MKISGSSGALCTARVGVRKGCPPSPTLFGIFFDSLDGQLQAESAAAGVEGRGARVPGLFYADDIALLSPSAQGLQQLLDGLKNQHPKDRGGGVWWGPPTMLVACRGAIASSVVNLSFIWACCFMRTDTSSMQFSIAWLEAMRLRGLSSYTGLGCANSVHLLLRLQQAILQPCASYACEVWAPTSACIGPFRDLHQLQRTFLRRACRVKKSILWTSYFRSCNRCVGMTSDGGGSLVSGQLCLRLIQALYTA